jgi:hypothetical protein
MKAREEVKHEVLMPFTGIRAICGHNAMRKIKKRKSVSA